MNERRYELHLESIDGTRWCWGTYTLAEAKRKKKEVEIQTAFGVRLDAIGRPWPPTKVRILRARRKR